jgi:hypothetical protein
MTSITALVPASEVTSSFEALRQRGVRGLAAVSISETKNPIIIMGNQPIPQNIGPNGTSHTPPAHAKRDTTRKNHNKLPQGPFVPKAREIIETIISPTTKATNRSMINMRFSFLY